jgi:hypothetical protein
MVLDHRKHIISPARVAGANTAATGHSLALQNESSDRSVTQEKQAHGAGFVVSQITNFYPE